MKKVIFSLVLIFVATAATNMVVAQVSGAGIEFEKDVHDYGTMEQHGDGTFEFRFKNIGDAPLTILNVKGSVGCTVLSWPKKPIAPGASAGISIKYDTGRAGAINKSIIVSSNARNEPSKVIRIKGSVKAHPNSGTPVKTSAEPPN